MTVDRPLSPAVLADDLRNHADALRHPDLALVDVLEQAADRLDEAPTPPPNARIPAGDPYVSLDELIYGVECALECAAIEVEVHELDIGPGGVLVRSGRTSSLHRLVRCLRSAGLIDEIRREDSGEMTYDEENP